MEIGKIQIDVPVFLAPMAGYTNLPFRLLCKKFGAGGVFTEMISAKGLYYRDKKTASLMVTDPDETPAGIQIFGSDPDVLETVIAQYINPLPFALLDFNAGCPAPKIFKNGDGSALLGDLPLLAEIIRRIKKVSNKPLTVKMRLGLDAAHIVALEAAAIIEDAGADAITVHGRTRKAFYSGKADWQIIGEIKKRAGIPVIANGDVTDGESARQLFETTGCDGIMVGRAAVGNPFIFEEIVQTLYNGQHYSAPTPEQKMQTALEHIGLLDKIDHPGKIKEMRKHLVGYTKGLNNAAAMRTAIFQTETEADLVELFTDYARKEYGTELRI